MLFYYKKPILGYAAVASLCLGIALVSGCTGGSGADSSIDSSAVPVTIAPDNTRIRYTGCVIVTSSAALYDWSNTQIEFLVDAEQIELLFNDGKNDYNVFVDGQPGKTISTTANKTTYPLTVGRGIHHVLLSKRTGPNFGPAQFLGLRLPNGGQLLELPAAPARKIEFIGDSWTVGYGNEGPGVDCGGELRRYENSYLSFAAITARALKAQSHSIAISGRGAVRNYGDTKTTSDNPMPLYFGRTFMERADLPWDFQSWVPDAVVIKLGTNDHSTQPEPSAAVFIEGIQGLITQVITAYGQVPIILIADSSMPHVVSRMKTAMHEQHSRGNSNVNFVQVTSPPQSQLGCDWHPSVTGQEAIAAELVAASKPILGW
ncbi:MAG TPA: SGNH/GDSL hydrolase family protein [Cellvibrio sp.]|nr:SGNH/GDSL hydrolase family protein [Cellvibrio sp.]